MDLRNTEYGMVQYTFKPRPIYKIITVLTLSCNTEAVFIAHFAYCDVKTV